MHERNTFKRRFATIASSTALAVLGVGVADARAGGPAVVIESSFDGAMTSHPSEHHRVTTDPTSGESSDWASDFSAGVGASVTPRLKGPYGTTLKVMDVKPACSGVDGGTAVRVSVHEPNGGPEIGWVAFLHLSEVAVQPGQVVYPDTVLGKVGSFTENESCWTGPHVHIEGFNRKQYSCFYDPQSVTAGTPVGRVGGDDIGAPRTHCP